MEMVCDILNVVVQGKTKPTHILYKANLSWKVLLAHLEYLTSRGLVVMTGEEDKRCTYEITQKGRTILQLYHDLRISLYGALDVEGGPKVSEPVAAVPVIPRVSMSARRSR
jgi:predicted transcriptional regulator